jgi:hypothetical protein
MARMSESFIDLTYRGLSLGRRLKLSDVRPTTGYVETPAPMPVGTQIGILTDDTVALDAVVVEIREQITGSERIAGMLIRPRLEGDAARSWWQRRVSGAEPEPAPPPAPETPAQVTVMPQRMTNPGLGVPELVDDGKDTGVMDAVDPAAVQASADEAPQTVAMDAVDLKALGLTTPSGEMTSVQSPIEGDEPDGNGANGNGDKPEGKSKRKRRRR